MIKCPELLVSTEKKFKLPNPIQRIKGEKRLHTIFQRIKGEKNGHYKNIQEQIF